MHRATLELTTLGNSVSPSVSPSPLRASPSLDPPAQVYTEDFFQLFWPIVLAHKIDEVSPLWAVSPEDLRTEQFEIIITLEGTTPETGNNIQVSFNQTGEITS